MNLVLRENAQTAAIIMTLLCANITYNTNNCYLPKTLEKSSFHDYIKRYTNPGQCPIEIIQGIFDGTNGNAKMLKTVMNVMAFIPTKTETNISKLMEVMRTQSWHVSKNKLSSTARTLSTHLSDCLKQCSPHSVTSVPVKKQPDILHTYQSQSAMNEKTVHSTKQRYGVEDDLELRNWIPDCINNFKWRDFLKNPF